MLKSPMSFFISSKGGFSYQRCVDPPTHLSTTRICSSSLSHVSHVLLTGPVAMFGVPNRNFHVTRRRERLPGFTAHHVVTFRYLVSSSFGRTFLRLLYVSFQLFCFLFFLRLGRVASRFRFFVRLLLVSWMKTTNRTRTLLACRRRWISRDACVPAGNAKHPLFLTPCR